MDGEKKRIAIIGGGISGFGSILELKAEGLEPVCFESTDKPIGTWCYREDSIPGYASIMPTTVQNNSKEMSSLSIFPPRKEYNNYMRHTEAHEYYCEIMKHFDLERHVRYSIEVVHVKKSNDYAETGSFLVTAKNKISGEVSTEKFDGVIVATGHFNIPMMETLPGQEKFKGDIIHSHSLKGVERYKGKNVLIIGDGCSGLDAATEISSVSKQVYFSTRCGVYAMSKLGPGGYPIDYILQRRYLNVLKYYVPTRISSLFIETFYLDVKFDHSLYYVQPKYHVLGKEPAVNDAIFSKLLSGSVIQKGQVKHFTENGVVFDGEELVTEIDSVVMATGYTWDHPFLEEGLLETENGRINLYKCMYPIQLPHSSLVFIGFVNPFSPGVPVGEMQCRWAAQMFAGRGKLPPREIMLNDVVKRHEINLRRFAPSVYMSIRVDGTDYLDDIASEIGAKPNLMKYFFTDFPLYLKLVFGPSVPYQYRLEGPHKWEGAREAIMTSNERVLWPLTREKNAPKSVLQLLFELIGNLVPRNIFLY